MSTTKTADELINESLLKILAKSKLKLFGCLIYKFDLKLIDVDPSVTAYCFIDRVLKKPCIHFNKHFLNEHINDVEETIFVILHEMIHFIDGHHSKFRVENKDPKIFNLAADHIINTMLIKDANDTLKGIIKKPSHCFVVPELEGQDVTLMEVYEWLIDNQPRITIKFRKHGQPKPQKGDSIDKNGNPNPQSQDEENEAGQIVDVYIDGKYSGSATLDLDAREGPDSESNADDAEISNELKSEVRAIINNILNKTSNTNRGYDKGAMYEYLEKASRLVVPWYVLLENAIQTTMSKSKSNKSWKNIRKKIRHLGLTLPDNSKEEIKDNLYVIQDTSGSMGTEEQQKFADLILQSINYFKTIKVIQHDHGIQNILELTRDNFELEKDNIFKIYGRGGTSHKECFDYIEHMFFDEDERISLVILATDYYSDVENIWNSYDFHNHIPIKVLCTEKGVQIAGYVDKSPIYC